MLTLLLWTAASAAASPPSCADGRYLVKMLHPSGAQHFMLSKTPEAEIKPPLPTPKTKEPSVLLPMCKREEERRSKDYPMA